jgi:glucosylceramidase
MTHRIPVEATSMTKRRWPAALAALGALLICPAWAFGQQQRRELPKLEKLPEQWHLPTARWVATTAERQWIERNVEASAEGETALALTATRRQMMEGFGGCFNEAGWRVLSLLTPADRQLVMKALFDAEEGCAFNLCRLPIGASDYALEWYSLDETDGDLEMRQFSIERDGRLLIPYAKAALAYCPNLRFFASPWSPPTWMKTPPKYNGGVLRWEKPVLDAYALYLLKYVRAYATEGIKIGAIHVQNEPNSDQKFPSCLWTGEQMRDFIRDQLGPLFAREIPGTEIWAGTIERDDVDKWANLILADAAARKYVAGVGYQWGGRGAVAKTHEAWPKLRMLQTENECGDGKNSWDYAFYVAGLMKDYITNGVGGYVYWNMVLPTGGESSWGWRQNSMISIDPETKAVTYNPEFYVMRHLSRFVVPNATRLEVTGAWAETTLAFENPGGERVLFVFNPKAEARELALADGKLRFKATLDARSFNTFTWKQSPLRPPKGWRPPKPPGAAGPPGKDR